MTGTDLEALAKRASEAARARRLDEAATLLEQILEADPEHLNALDLFGFVRFFQGRYAEAESYCRRALARSPDHAYAHKGLGLCVAKQGRVEEGIASLERAITLKPTWGDPYWDLGVVLQDAGRLEEALEVLERGEAFAKRSGHDFIKFQTQVRRRIASLNAD